MMVVDDDDAHFVMLPLQKKVKLDDDFSKKKELVSALLSSSKNDSRYALAEEDEKKLFLLLPALLSFLSYFSLSLSVSLLERAQSFFFKADEACCVFVFENCTKTLNIFFLQLVSSLLNCAH